MFTRQHLLKQYVALSFFPKALKPPPSETHDVLPNPLPNMEDPCLTNPLPPHSETHVSYPPTPLYHQRSLVSFPALPYDVFADPPPPTLGEPWCLSRPPPPTYHQRPMVSFPPPTYHQRPMVSSPNSPPKGGSRACMIVLTTSLMRRQLSACQVSWLWPESSGYEKSWVDRSPSTSVYS